MIYYFFLTNLRYQTVLKLFCFLISTNMQLIHYSKNVRKFGSKRYVFHFSVIVLNNKSQFVMKKRYAALLILFWLTTSFLHAQPYKWVRQLGTTGDDITTFVKITSQKGVCVSGNVNGFMQLQNNSLTHNGGYIAMYDSSGNDQWIIPCGEFRSGYASSYSYRNPTITLDASDNIYACGYYSDSVLIGTTWLIDTGDYNCFLAKINANGVVQWARKITDQSFMTEITLDRLGNIIVAGNVNGVSNFDGTLITPFGTGTLGDIVLAKYDAAGNLIWVKQAGGTGFYSDVAESVTTDYAGNIYIGGNFRSTAQFDNLTIVPVNFATYDGFVAKYNATGNAQWVNHAGHDCSAIVSDSAGNIYFGGAALPGNFNGLPVNALGGGIMYVAKMNTSGVYQWLQYNHSNAVAQNGNTDFSLTVGIALDEQQNCYVTGMFWDSLVIGNLTMISYLPPACFGTGSRINSFVVCLDSAGNTLWGKPLQSCAGASGGFSLNVKGCTIAACGQVRIPPAAIYFDNDSLVSLGGYDGYVVMIDSCFNPTGLSNTKAESKNTVVYPNPLSDFTTFYFSDKSAAAKQLVISDVLGKEIFKTETKNTLYKLDVKSFSKGIYLYKINSENKLLQSGKLIVN